MLPTSWRRIPITGRFVGRDGVPVVGRLIFDSLQIVEIDGNLIVPRKIFVVLNANGEIPAETSLPSTHDPDLSVTGWAYTVTEDWIGGRKPYRMFVPYDAVSISIPEAAHAVPPPALLDNRGPRGYSAYEVAVAAGFEGTEAEWLESLQNGPAGPPGPTGPTEYGVSLNAAAGEVIATGGYSAARSAPQAASFTRVYFETDAEITVRIEFNGIPVFEDTLAAGTVSRQIETVSVEAGQSIVFVIVAGEATRAWGQIDGGVVADILTLDNGEPLTLDDGEPIEL